jgi:N-acetylglucosamine malate deacetylase 1
MDRPVDLLLITAHCDDGELWAGGTIARSVEAGKRVTLAIAHHNSVRRREAEAAAAILGCEVWFREQQMELGKWASNCLEQARPEVLLTHPPNDPHFEHRDLSERVSWGLIKSKERKVYPHRWYHLETYYSTHSHGFPLLIDITEFFNKKCSALGCHISQMPDDLIQMAQAMNALHGQQIRKKHAEAFYPFPLLGRWPKLRELP